VAGTSATGKRLTHGGQPQLEIPFDRIAGPVLAIAGTDDQLWPSGTAAGTVARATGGESVLYVGAGHGVGTLPYPPAGTSIRHALLDGLFPMGRSRPATRRRIGRAGLGFSSSSGRLPTNGSDCLSTVSGHRAGGGAGILFGRGPVPSYASRSPMIRDEASGV